MAPERPALDPCTHTDTHTFLLPSYIQRQFSKRVGTSLSPYHKLVFWLLHSFWLAHLHIVSAEISLLGGDPQGEECCPGSSPGSKALGNWTGR